MIRVVLPAHLRSLAQIDGELSVEVKGDATQRSILDALETSDPLPRPVATGVEAFLVIGAIAGG